MKDYLAGVSLLRNFTHGQTIQFQNEAIESISLIVTGHASVQFVTLDGQEVWIDDLAAGDVFGFEAWIGENRANCEIITLSKVSLLSIPAKELTRIVQDEPQIMIKIMESLATRYHAQTQRLIETKGLTSRGQICAELKRYAKPIGIDPGRYIIRPIPVFSKFAVRVGSTRETVSRMVSDLSKAGIIERQTGALVITNMAELETYIR